MWSGTLTVEFVGERHEIAPPRLFTFGRHGDLPLDTTAGLPSVIGVFAHESGSWWLRNQATAIDIHLFDADTRSALLIAAGTAAPITYKNALVRMVVGPSTYELNIVCADGSEQRTYVERAPDRPTLNLEQRQLLTALAEGCLRGAGSLDLPSNAEVAQRLGWRITKLNRKLDHLCIKFDKLGVAGLRGSARRLATERRRLLVEHCVTTGLISVDDLTLLPMPDGQPQR